MLIRTRGALAVLTSLALLSGTVASVHAADDLFEALFGGGRPAEVQQPSQPGFSPGAPNREYRPRSRRAARQHIRIRYAALPIKIRVSERDKADDSGRQKALDMSKGPVAALLKDDTLRPGDIVVFNTGARIFTGNPEKTHALRDFEPVQNSTRIDKRTRQQLAAMLAPVGALPADEARKVLARLKKATPRTDEPAIQQAVAMRVINPWSKAP